MYQLRTSMEHSLFDGLTWHCLVGSMWGTWKAKKFTPFPQTELASSGIAVLQPFQPFFPAFGVQTADTLRVFGKFLPDLGLMIPVFSIQVAIAHCSSKKNSTRASFHQHLWDTNPKIHCRSLTASDGSSTPSRILSPSVSHSFLILGRLTPLSPLPTCKLFDVAPKNPRKVSNLKVRF